MKNVRARQTLPYFCRSFPRSASSATSGLFSSMPTCPDDFFSLKGYPSGQLHWIFIGEYEGGIWDLLPFTMSSTFEASEQKQIAVKVIDDWGNELLVVEKLGEVKS